MASDHPVDLGLEHLADEVGVDAVDDELQALAGELVVDLADLRVEREQPLAPGLLGQRDEQVDAAGDVRRLGAEDASCTASGSA